MDPNISAERLRLELEACYSYLRDTLEDLNRAAGLPIVGPDDRPLSNWRLVENLEQRLSTLAHPVYEEWP